MAGKIFKERTVHVVLTWRHDLAMRQVDVHNRDLAGELAVGIGLEASLNLHPGAVSPVWGSGSRGGCCIGVSLSFSGE